MKVLKRTVRVSQEILKGEATGRAITHSGLLNSSNRPSASARICRRAVISPEYTFYSCFVGTDDPCHYSCRKSGGHCEMQGPILTACTCHINNASIFSLIGQDVIPVFLLICASCFKDIRRFKCNLPTTKKRYISVSEKQWCPCMIRWRSITAHIFFARVLPCL